MITDKRFFKALNLFLGAGSKLNYRKCHHTPQDEKLVLRSIMGWELCVERYEIAYISVDVIMFA